MDSYTETFGSWQSNAPFGAAVLRVPASAASYDATDASFGGVARTDATAVAAGLGQPKTMRNHKSITRPGSPPRGRHR